MVFLFYRTSLSRTSPVDEQVNVGQRRLSSELFLNVETKKRRGITTIQIADRATRV